MLIFALAVSTSFTVGAAITDAVDPIALTWLRFLMAAAIFAGLLFATSALQQPGIADLGRYTVIGSLLCIYFVTMFWGLRWTDPVSLGAIFTLAPIFTALFGRWLLGQQTSPVMVLSLVVSGAGAVWVLFDGSLARLMRFSIGKGELIFLAGTVAYAIYSPAIRALHKGESLLVMNFWVIVLSAALLFVFGFQAIMETAWSQLPFYVYAGIAWLAAASTALSFYMIKYASLRLPSSKVLAYTYLIPAFVLAQTAFAGGPAPTISELAGIAVITASMLILQRA